MYSTKFLLSGYGLVFILNLLYPEREDGFGRENYLEVWKKKTGKRKLKGKDFSLRKIYPEGERMHGTGELVYSSDI